MLVDCELGFDFEFVFGLQEKDFGFVLGFWFEGLNGVISLGLCLCLVL